jgi:NADPH:quinone reductase
MPGSGDKDLSPAEGQALIASEAIGVGGVDALIRSGAVAAYGFQQGHVLGSEVAGTVTAVGDSVRRSWIGQRVWAFTGLGGGYAEHTIVPAESLVPLPAGLSAVDAVTLGTSGVVAHFGLRHAHFAPGQSVLVRGAAGGIGIMTVQLRRHHRHHRRPGPAVVLRQPQPRRPDGRSSGCATPPRRTS